MPAVTTARLEPVNAFPIENTVLFKHYFDGEAVFDRLQPFYNGTQYRFEVPAGEFDSLQRFLCRHGYDVSIVHRPVAFYVAVRQYTAHPDGIFKRSVRNEQVDDYNCFLMVDQAAVAWAVAEGATRLTDTSLAVHSGTLADFTSASA